MSLRKTRLKIYFIAESIIKMKFSLLIIFIAFQLYLFTGCSPFRKGKELIEFENLQFSFQDPSNSQFCSVLFSQSDTVFLKKYSNSNNDTLLYSIFPDSDRLILNSFIISFDSLTLHLSKPHSIEASGKTKFSLYIDYSNENQRFDFDGLPPPLTFKEFYFWLNRMIKKLEFNLADTSINFKEDKKIHEEMKK